MTLTNDANKEATDNASWIAEEKGDMVADARSQGCYRTEMKRPALLIFSMAVAVRRPPHRSPYRPSAFRPSRIP